MANGGFLTQGSRTLQQQAATVPPALADGSRQPFSGATKRRNRSHSAASFKAGAVRRTHSQQQQLGAQQCQSSSCPEVRTAHEGIYVYGQVIATEGQRVSLRSPSVEVTAVSSKVEEVALVLCMLLHNAKIATKGMPRAKLKRYHSAILDRLLGNNRAEATRKISQVLDDMFTNHAPDPSTDCTWLDLDTEEVGKISLRHAVDFAHFVDGDKTSRPTSKS